MTSKFDASWGVKEGEGGGGYLKKQIFIVTKEIVCNRPLLIFNHLYTYKHSLVVMIDEKRKSCHLRFKVICGPKQLKEWLSRRKKVKSTYVIKNRFIKAVSF